MPETVPWDVDNYISLPLLATANVRFIISPIPIKSDELKLVDGPDALPLIYRQKYFKSLDEKLTYYTWYVKRFIEPWKVYIYEIPYALPRVYVAKGLIVADDDWSEMKFFDAISQHALSKAIVVRSEHGKMLNAALNSTVKPIRIKDYQLVGDGFDIRLDGAGGGVVVLNAAPQPFFRAFADGIEVPLVPANGIQIAVPVPAGAAVLKVRYRRPTLREKIKGYFALKEPMS